MAELIVPRKLQATVKESLERSRRFARFRAALIQQYVGQYYRTATGLEGAEPINLIYNAVRAIVPNMVMQSPVNLVTTDILDYKPYAELLGLGLDTLNRKLDMKNLLRSSIVDALFMMGIIKVGLSTSETIHDFGDIHYDNGMLFNELVDWDDFIFDPAAKSLETSAFVGDANRVPRQILLDNDNFDHDAVRALPSSSVMTPDKAVEKLSGLRISDSEMTELQDFVDVAELWIPEANAKIVIPDPRSHTSDDYLSAVEYYGPDDGPYAFLRLSPTVPGNPYPISPVGVFYDLHKTSNTMFQKIARQAMSQKNVGIYDPGHADEAEDLRDAQDGDLVAGDPRSVTMVSIGGQDAQNERMLAQLHIWSNYMAGNPDQLSGLRTPGGGDMTATQSQILQANSTVTIEDAKDMIYDFAARVNRKNAWYLHTDPLIELPLVKRQPGGEEEQVILTPEQRSGDFLDFTFRIKARSLTRLDPVLKSKRVLDFSVNVMPALANSATIMMQVGTPFNLARAIKNIAEEMGILDEVADWFVDPEFVQKLQLKMLFGPQDTGKAASSAAILQNGGPASTVPMPGPAQLMNQTAQASAAEGQSANVGAY